MKNKSIIIPKDWIVERLDSVCDVLIGGTPARKTAEYWDTSKNTNNVWVSISDITKLKGKYICDSSEYISDIGVKKSNVKLIPKDTVIMSFKLSIGKMAITKRQLFTNEAIAAFLVKDSNKILSDFIFYRLPSLQFEVDQAVKGKTLNKDKIKKVSILLPPIKEQKKIAEILSTVDHEIEKIDESIFKTEKLKKGLVTEFFNKGINHKKFKKTKIGLIPEEWKLVKMNDICEVRQGLQIAIDQRYKEPKDGLLVYITNQYIKDKKNADYIKTENTRVICNVDDVLMTRTGNTGIVVTGIKGVFHNNFFLINFNREVLDKDFFVFYLRSENIQKILLSKAGTTTIPDLNHGDFYSIPQILPSMDEQKKIAEILSSVDKQIVINKKIKERLLELKRGLLDDLLSGKIRCK